jgi:hypothetical protein
VSASQKTRYAATLHYTATHIEFIEFGTLAARTDRNAIEVSRLLARKWLTENDVDSVVLQVVRDASVILVAEIHR